MPGPASEGMMCGYLAESLHEKFVTRIQSEKCPFPGFTGVSEMESMATHCVQT